MSKFKSFNQRCYFKIPSDVLVENELDLELTDKLIKRYSMRNAGGNSQLFRFIETIKNENTLSKEKKIEKAKKDLKEYMQKDRPNGKKIIELREEINNLKLLEDIIAIKFNNKKHFKDIEENGVDITYNGVKRHYVRLVGTTGGVKASTVLFINSAISPILREIIECGASEEFKIIPAKLEAYYALCASGSTPLRKMPRIAVVKDLEIVIHENVEVLKGNVWDDEEQKHYYMNNKEVKEILKKSNKREDYGTDEEYEQVIAQQKEIISMRQQIKDYENTYTITEVKDYALEKSPCDGLGVMTVEFAESLKKELNINYIPSGVNTRCAYGKGMLFTMDCIKFVEVFNGASEENPQGYKFIDFWGNKQDIREIDVIMTQNQVKLAGAYKNIEDYVGNMKKYGWSFSITKVCPKHLERTRNLNYQFLQSYEFSDEDIKELCKDTVEYLRDVTGGDYYKSLLFLKGNSPIEEDDFENEQAGYVKALMVDKELYNYNYIRNSFINFSRKKIREAKKGNIIARGNYQIVGGDPFALLQHIFKLEVTGILGKEDYYSAEWMNEGVDCVSSFRAPMTAHSNIGKWNIIKKDKVSDMVKANVDDEYKRASYWFKYINTAIMVNIWNCDQEKMNGMDYDSDAVMTFSSRVLVDNVRPTLPLVCLQDSTPKVSVKVAKTLLAKANKNGFGNAVGRVTNVATAMYDTMAKFEKGTPEYNEMQYRLNSSQAIQQEVIDSIKGIKPRSFPKFWIDEEALDNCLYMTEEEKEFNRKLITSKKPYFFKYNYQSLATEDNSNNAKAKWDYIIKNRENPVRVAEEEGVDIQEVIQSSNNSNLTRHPSTMNRICMHLEKELKGLNKATKTTSEFDTKVFVTDKTKKDLDSVIKTLKQVRDDYVIFSNQYRLMDKEEKLNCRQDVMEGFKTTLLQSCGNEEIIINTAFDKMGNDTIVVSILFDLFRDRLIDNLLKHYKHHTVIRRAKEGEAYQVKYLETNYVVGIKEVEL